MPSGQDLIVAIITLGALMILLRNIARGRRSACGRGGCGCGPDSQPVGDRLGTRKELIQLNIQPAGESQSPGQARDGD